jgi:hypothetical protein
MTALPTTAPSGFRPALPAQLWWVACATALAVLAPSAPAAGASRASTPLDVEDPRDLLQAVADALEQPHVGRVSVVTFSEAGPRVADLDVRVDAMGGVELRRPTRWLLGPPSGGWLRTATGARGVAPTTTAARLDVEAVLSGWDAQVGTSRDLDTGPATPVHLVRRSGAAVQEVVYVDHATALPVRRETRAADGEVLRVVAYTSLSLLDVGGPSPVAHPEVTSMGPPDLATVEHDGYDVPRSLDAGFDLLSVEHHRDMAVARYGDGLSVLSVYQQHGRLDPSELASAEVRTIAGRHVWTWPGSEPLRLVWTGGERTWTVVSDAPLAVIEDALVSLPGDHVGHDVPSRIARGLGRAWHWLQDLTS